MEFEPVIGLEVHTQLKTKTKIFCSCSVQFGDSQNTNVCPVCLGMPGSLPVLNKEAVEYTLRMGLAIGCSIQKQSRFARKNYFYPDLPKGYQISQYELPIALNGHINIDVDGKTKKIGITRIHMEEDAGKLSHSQDRPVSFVDLNRTGTPLIEIVSEPDISSPQEAGAYLRYLHSVVRYLDISDGNMEQGSFRCDANVSIRPKGSSEMGTRTEIKNLNSFKHVEKAIAYEIDRQTEIILEGGQIVQETRLWDPDKNRTFSMRSKEEAHDYRYFPDPDLLPLVISEEWIDKVKSQMPELPEEKKQRFISEYKLPCYDAGILTSSRELADYFEQSLKTYNNPKSLSNWIMGNLLGLLNSKGKTIEESPITAQNLGQLLNLLDKGTISGKIAKTVFDEIAETGKEPQKIIEEKGLVQVSDKTAIKQAVSEILEKNPSQVQDYKNGKTKILGFFVGQIMKKTKGKANPAVVNEVLQEELAK